MPGGAKEADFEDLMKRSGITRQCVSLQQTPMGDFVVVFFEGPNPGAVMASLGSSTNEFEKWFAQNIKELHGIDASQPPPGPMSELVLDYTG